MGFSDGEFIGYFPPTDNQVTEALSHGFVVVDANVLLGLYRHLPPARDIAFRCLTALGDRLWVPHQVAREYWRHRAKELKEFATPASPLGRVREDIRQHVNRLTPATSLGADIGLLKDELISYLDQLEAKLTEALGEPLNVELAISAPSQDPVASKLMEILVDRVGDNFADEDAAVATGLKRFSDKIPPGFKDGPEKRDQRPEKGTGDYLLWEQTLLHLEAVGISSPFVIVTGDEKEDWRLKLDKRVLGPHPALVAEAIDRLSQPVYIISPDQFYDHMTALNIVGDPEAVGLLISGSGGEEPGGWDTTTYEKLINLLELNGYTAQAESIRRAAASPEGFVSRAEVYELADFESSRSLRRFSLPARRLMLGLIEDGQLSETAELPLVAEYDGPGQAIGFLVPEVFTEIARGRPELTWIDAAEIVAADDPERFWTVSELIQEIRARGLKDMSRARTPEATLRRDLAVRQQGRFESNGEGAWRLCVFDPTGE